jgi:type I restriction enzyme M protein
MQASCRKARSFADLVALTGRIDIGNQINTKIIAPLATANKLGGFPDFDDSGN